MGRDVRSGICARSSTNGSGFSYAVIIGDFTEEIVLREADAVAWRDRRVDVVLSDMAPNMSGNRSIDQPRAMYLCELALDFARQTLNPGGSFFVETLSRRGF